MPLYGVDMVRGLDMNCCSICNENFEGYGNNAQPVNDGVCCDDCNNLVIGARMKNFLIREKFTGR